MNDRHVLFGLHELGGIGWKTIRRLESALSGAWSELLAAEKGDLLAFGLKPAMADTIKDKLTPELIARRLEEYRRGRISFMTALDADYPALLREIAQPPWVLYLRGDRTLLERSCIAVVGTRSPTAYGRKAAYELARDLSACGVCVVSGLARGIDACAHRGALTEYGSTAAVLGCGLDTIYPSENASLYAEIAEKGVLVTEYPLGTRLHAGLFPQRNRIIAGLCLGTLVVEAAERSGSLITADQALEQSRDVFAVPGPITSAKSAGTLELIRQGAKMVASAEHILEEYNGLAQLGHTRKEAASGPDPSLSADERKLLGLMSAAPVTTDELVELSGFEFGHLHSVLLNLTLKKKIVPLPGSSYASL
ncbi:DNA-protecting protein DprA [Paenibacillus flagellatus]|uniref:DNA-protecting protein DprA n=1 Tax=Paenibacillus flagellatus TaxID=2211139 RepID=A0A2V5K9E5_9BACL|nr:DNA-processing protein DprA [Paenibacillus flagellatus]PYI50440.1 DNA-protecting protein DprA [Paenibacillus flagellatus]